MEVECSVIGNEDPVASEPGELVVNAEWYDYEAKYQPGGMDLVVPARLEDATRARVRELAVEVFRRSGCAGLARVDFFVEDGGRVLVNELNTMPGFTETSVFPKLFEESGHPVPGPADAPGRARDRAPRARAHATGSSAPTSCRVSSDTAAFCSPSGSAVIQSR